MPIATSRIGQILDKKATLKRVIQTNIALGRVQAGTQVDTRNLMVSPRDRIYRILSKEKDYESQAERLYEGLAREIGSGNQRAVNQIQARLDTLAKYGSAYVSLRDGLEFDKRQLSELKAKYEESKVDAQSSMPQKFVVDYAFKAEKKSYPVRWLIVVISTFTTLLTSIILIILYENFRKFKQLSATE